MFDVLGMNATVESVYREMLAHPRDGIADLTRRLQLTEQSVRTALDTLSELTLVRQSLEDSRRLHPVAPSLAAEILLSRQQAELAAQQQRVREAQAAVTQIKSEFLPEDIEDEAHRLRGAGRVRDFLATLYDQAEDELLFFAPGGERTADDPRGSRPFPEKKPLERGVRVRTVYRDSARNDPRTVRYAEWLGTIGGRVRTAPSLPNRVVICDRRTALVAADPEDDAAGAVVLRTTGVVSSLYALFENVWQSARPMGATVSAADEQGLTPQQREVLRLLSLGHTDESVAMRLGVSARTARRAATALMAQLGARSRFQAGVQAAARGLFRP